MNELNVTLSMRSDSRSLHDVVYNWFCNVTFKTRALIPNTHVKISEWQNCSPSGLA